MGAAAGRGGWSAGLTHAAWYMPVAGLLLAVGLYGSTHGIDRTAVRRDLRTVVVVVTFGVLLKAAFIGGVMLLVFRRPEFLVLGIAVAQIDPLSVAALSDGTRMSPRARSLLATWAAFDDPMTVLLSIYFPLTARHLAGGPGVGDPGVQGGGWISYAESAGYNVALGLAGFAAWYAVKRRAERRGRRGAGAGADTGALAVAGGVIVAGAVWTLMPAVAVTGLFARVGRHTRWVDRAVGVAFVLAAGGLGVLLARGFSPVEGVVLGAAAFAAQAVVSLLVLPLTVPELSRTDRVCLALSQQNGITAIVLAVTLEPAFPGTVGVVAPAVLTIGVLYYVANAVWNRHLAAAGGPSAPPAAGPAREGPPAPVREGGATARGHRCGG